MQARARRASRPSVPRRHGPARASTQRCATWRERGVDTIAISGGDGTVHAVLDTIFGRNPFPRRPLLAVLRGGTANMTARDIGMRGRQHRALAALIEASRRGGEGLVVTGRPVMRIDPGAGRAPLHGMFFGAAAISQGIDYCKRNVHALGLRGEIGPAVTMARFVIAMARGERAIVAPVPITVSGRRRPARELRLRDRPRHDAGGARPRVEAVLGHRSRAAALRERARRSAALDAGAARPPARAPQSLRRPQRTDTKAATRIVSSSGSTRRSSSTARSSPRRRALPLALTDGGTAEFVTLR